MAMTDSPCGTIRDLLVDYDDDTLPVAQAARVQRHLADCADCRAERQALRRSLELAREVWTEAAAEVEARPVHRPVSRLKRVPRAALAGAAAAAIVAGAALWLWNARTIESNGGAVEDPSPISVAQAVRMIEREGAAARLAASAEILAARPETGEFARDALRYVTANYADTVAGKEAESKMTPN